MSMGTTGDRTIRTKSLHPVNVLTVALGIFARTATAGGKFADTCLS